MDKKTDVPAQANRRPGKLLRPTASFDKNRAIPANTKSLTRVNYFGPEGSGRILLKSTPSLLPSLPDIATARQRAADRETVRRNVLMLGLRGVPDIQGGVEKHVEMLAQELVLKGWDVEVVGRSQYLPRRWKSVWRGIRVTPLWAPSSMALEAFFHTFFGIFYAAVKRPDIVHIHAIGPGLFAPLARLLGLRVVVTHHGYDYDREKWNSFAKFVLKLGERLAIRLANGNVAVSREVTQTMLQRYGRTVAHIPNGVVVRPALLSEELLNRFGLRRRRYVVMVARFVPEKRQTDLIKAFAHLNQNKWKLALVGGSDHRDSAYARQVEELAAATDGVVLTGFQSGDDLAALFSQAGLFVLPSAHEGMPIALLEALGYGLPVLASDIVANHEVALASEDYFPVGDIDALAAALRRKMNEPFEADKALARIHDIERSYAWPSISRDTIMVYRNAMNSTRKRDKR